MSESIIRKVGLISCSGEDLPEGTISRIATRLVLEELRPLHTVTICLPLFLAGGEAERAFARNQPTITIDGCDKLCARRATTTHSGKPAASFIVSEFVDYQGFAPPTHRRTLDQGEMSLTRALAESIASEVGLLVEAQRSGGLDGLLATHNEPDGKAAYACQSGGPPARAVQLSPGAWQVVALDAIMAEFARAGRRTDAAAMQDMLGLVKIYNAIPPDAEVECVEALRCEYERFLDQQGKQA